MIATDPIARFLEAFERAKSREPADPTAMVLATADARGRPSARLVLLKEADARGFVFFTNRHSRKGKELEENPHAALCIHWPVGGEQIRVEGPVAPVPDEESDAYFLTRARGSQIGAWASEQSRPVASREALLARVREIEARFEGMPVPRPPHWGGYRLTPSRIEFWTAGEHRLHDRESYERDAPSAPWRLTRLQP